MTVLADELPCEVLLPEGGLLRRARAIITDEGVSVYIEERPGETPVLAFRARLHEIPELPHPLAPKRRRVYDLKTEQGSVKVNAVAGCLCNFPALRTYSPERLRDEVRSGLIPSAAV